MSWVVILSLAGFLALLLLLFLTAATVVPEDQVMAVYVFGDLKGIVGPGVYFFPPFVTSTSPVDTSEMEILTDEGPEPVPPAFERQARAYEKTGYNQNG
ncbi:hypothetical protein BRC81_09815 [Halobacteriales archaeon QS_1_68_20]|nr:MAG: hypothetical protein BRC81_09815 [Halobacteriales archaeon QS_1_68_20]